MALETGWYEVHQMGHVVHYGHVQEVEVAGAKMLLVTLPAAPGEGPTEAGYGYESLAEEQIYTSGASLYAIVPSTEARILERRTMERRVLRRIQRALPESIEEAEVIEDGAPGGYGSRPRFPDDDEPSDDAPF